MNKSYFWKTNLNQFLISKITFSLHSADPGTLFFVQKSATGCEETITVGTTYGKENKMITSPSFTTLRNQAVNEFNTLRTRAVRDSWWAKLFRRKNGPRSFLASGATGLSGKRLAGIHNIRLESIVGTIQRNGDFDGNFRPLRKHLRDRWVHVLLQLDTDGWAPIAVHKVGQSYFIQDGHHRVSVAKSVGMMFIEAEVWDHTPCQPASPAYRRSHEVARRHATVYSANS